MHIYNPPKFYGESGDKEKVGVILEEISSYAVRYHYPQNPNVYIVMKNGQHISFVDTIVPGKEITTFEQAIQKTDIIILEAR